MEAAGGVWSTQAMSQRTSGSPRAGQQARRSSAASFASTDDMTSQPQQVSTLCTSQPLFESSLIHSIAIAGTVSKVILHAEAALHRREPCNCFLWLIAAMQVIEVAQIGKIEGKIDYESTDA